MSKQTTSALALHEGQALMALAQTYEGLPRVILELVQNGLDQGAQRIWVDIHYGKRIIAVRDNGDGINQSQFETALLSIGKSIKDRGKLGQYGRGMVSPLGKCEVMKFTSTPRRDPKAYRTWTFVTDELAERDELGGIPVEERSDLWFGTSVGKVEWRTEVRLEKFTPDRQISDTTIESLKAETCLRYGVVMRRNNVSVTIRIIDAGGEKSEETFEAPDYAGEPIKVCTFKSDDAGSTTFRLFIPRADKKYRSKGKVVIGISGDDFRISFDNLIRSAPEGFRREMSEAIEALNSGYFEGEILNSLITKSPGRESFVVNDRLASFCLAITEWFDTIGRDRYKEIQEARENGRLQDLGRRSLAVFEKLLSTAEGEFLREIIARFKRGSVAKGHTPKVSQEFTDFKAARAAVVGDNGAEDGRDHRGKVSPGYEKPDDTPMVVAGPDGSKRAVVRSNSLGITLMHDVLPDSRMWELDAERGILRLNIRHPLWSRCADRGTISLMRFQEYLIAQAFASWGCAEELRAPFRLMQENEAATMAFVYTTGDVISGRNPAGKKRKDGEGTKPAKRPARSLAIGK